MIFENIIFFKN